MTEIQRCAKCGHQKELHTEGECVACPKSSVDAYLHEFVSDSRVQQLEQRIGRLREALKKSIQILEEYAARNPKWIFEGKEQDPLGTHALLPKARAALKESE